MGRNARLFVEITNTGNIGCSFKKVNTVESTIKTRSEGSEGRKTGDTKRLVVMTYGDIFND